MGFRLENVKALRRELDRVIPKFAALGRIPAGGPGADVTKLRQEVARLRTVVERESPNIEGTFGL